MPIINKGTSFSNGEQLTADKINDLVDLATFNQNATDSNTTTINTTGQIVVNSGGISAAQLATDAVETAKIKDANVTTAKILDANVTFAKLTDVIDDDTMTTATDTTLATSESIKAYVDNLPGIKAHCIFDGTQTGTFQPFSGSYGITSITRVAKGFYTVTMSVTAPSSVFTCLASGPTPGTTVNISTGAVPITNTTVRVTSSLSNGNDYDGALLSFAAIW
jgi:hypothetical protein